MSLKEWLQACQEKLESRHTTVDYGQVTYLVPEWAIAYRVDARLYAVAKYESRSGGEPSFTLPRSQAGSM